MSMTYALMFKSVEYFASPKEAFLAQALTKVIQRLDY